ncbi:helix-hairpin-helix domain-containing protein [bacterium]|nr:helix-hairpin-helix domain-containing protein [bacterium]NUN46399.1 helix-hairpin-helix domain-containing protein [bacterium]
MVVLLQRISFFIALVFYSSAVVGQDTLWIDTDQDRSTESALESMTETANEGVEFSEALENWRRDPLDINRADIEELQQLPGLSPILAKAIVDRRRAQPFTSVRQLLQIDGFSRELFVRIQPFLIVYSHTAVRPLDVALRQRTERQIEKAPEFSDGSYEGGPLQMYERAVAVYAPGWAALPDAQIRGAWVMEKDPGETRWNDHQAGYAEIKNAGVVRRAVVGNYRLEFGQGVALWSGSGMSKSTEVIQSVKRRSGGIKPFASATENQALQGMAAELQFENVDFLRALKLTGFYSYAHFDASRNPDGTTGGLDESGLHRQTSENRRRDYLLETLGGFHADYQINSATRLGTTYYAHQFNRRFVPNDPVRNRYDFEGHRNRVGSISYDYYYEHVNFFGEWAMDGGADKAGNTGVQFFWPHMEFVFFYRNYAKNFHSLRGYAFGEQNGRTRNEEGIYTGWKYEWRRRLTIQAYYDLYRFPWRTYDVPTAVTGRDFLTQADFALTRAMTITMLYKREEKDDAIQSTDILGRDITIVEPSRVQRLRIQIEMLATPQFRFRSRIETSYYAIPSISGTSEMGLLIYEDVRFQPDRRWTLYGRVSVFDADSKSAVYEYENDVEGAFANTRFSGKGLRWYVFTQYHGLNRMDIGFKYWQMARSDISGYGRMTRRVTLSVDYKL